MSDDAPAELVEEASAAFDAFCESRHEMGAAKYGPVKFMTANTLEEAMAEVIDLANYARYTFIKLYLLNVALAKLIPDTLLGGNSFVPNGEDGR